MKQITQLQNRSAFTSSTDDRDLSGGRYIDEIILDYQGDMTGANSVTVANLLDIVQPFTIKLAGSPVIQIRGSDLVAFNQLVMGTSPFTIVAGSVTDDNTAVMGLRVPVHQPPRPKGSLVYRATRVAVSGIDTETLTVTEKSSDNKVWDGGYLNYIEIPMTSAGATGFGNTKDLPRVEGDLIGILFFSTTIPSATTGQATATVDQVRVLVNDRRMEDWNWETMKGDGKLGNQALWTSPADNSILDNYGFIDFRKDPIPKGNKVTLDINAQQTSSAIRIIPIYVC